MLPTFKPPKLYEPANSISLSKCPVFPTNALFVNFLMWPTVQMLKLPVEETKMPTSDMTACMATIWTPSKHACRARSPLAVKLGQVRHRERGLGGRGRYKELQHA